MTVKLISTDDDTSIQINELRDGQIAIITAWSLPYYIGRIVQRCEDRIISVGYGRTEYWMASELSSIYDICLVKVLPNGTQLVIVDNE